MAQHLIFEGVELSGKSWLMSRVYNYLEQKHNRHKYILDGCHWFNCDVGIYGTEYGRPIITSYLKIFQKLKEKNLLIEKMHLSDIVYSRLYRKINIDYRAVEKELQKMNFKIILITFPEDKRLLKKRIRDRLNLYPHYERIAREPEWYIKQQREYLKEIKKGCLPYLVVKTDKLPDEKLMEKILKWSGEK